MPWPERSPLPAGAGPPRARAFPRGGGWGRARPPRAGRAAEGCGPPGGVGGCPTAGPDGSNKRRGSGRGHPVSCPLSLGRAGGAFPSLSLSESGPRGAQSRPQPPLPPVPAPGRAAGGRGPGPHRPRVFPPVPPPRARPRLCPAGSPGYRKSLPTEVPPSATSGPGAERPRLHRGQVGTGTGPGPGPGSFGRGPAGSGLTRAGRGRGEARGRGSAPPRPFGGRGIPAVFPWGSVGRTGPSVSPGAGREGPGPPRPGGASPCPGAGGRRDRLLGAPRPPGPSRPVPQQRGHGEPPALRGPHRDGAERQRGGGVRRPQQVRIGGNRGAGAPREGGVWARRGRNSFTFWVQNRNFLSRRWREGHAGLFSSAPRPAAPRTRV